VLLHEGIDLPQHRHRILDERDIELGGTDAHEAVHQYNYEEDFFVFRSMTPPRGKTLRELELER
jgi:hypothetical protein